MTDQNPETPVEPTEGTETPTPDGVDQLAYLYYVRGLLSSQLDTAVAQRDALAQQVASLTADNAALRAELRQRTIDDLRAADAEAEKVAEETERRRVAAEQRADARAAKSAAKAPAKTTRRKGSG